MFFRKAPPPALAGGSLEEETADGCGLLFFPFVSGKPAYNQAGGCRPAGVPLP